MKIAVQDPGKNATYVLDPELLGEFTVKPAQLGEGADVVFVLPSKTLCEQVPVVAGTGSADPSILISDPDGDRRWLLTRSALERFAADGQPPTDAVWFSMPDASAGIYSAVPLFRRALVQNSS
ncbi:hypothetical protein Slala04_00910 [Streptomyces lavendulae subsp. lavendulae]|nr:hypothetical protein Slala04_00910 [Streptomyces lavendulae subsp. lavendulae]